jgi:hypothetical protein
MTSVGLRLPSSLIPSTKAAPEWILDLLRIVSSNTGDLPAMKIAIHQYLLGQSTRGKRNERNSVYAIAFPTLDRLGLKQGKGENVRLSPDGEILLKASKSGIDAYKKLFAKIVYKADSEKAHVLEALRRTGEGSITKDELVSSLKSLGVSTYTKDDRLAKWLRFLEFSDFISRDESACIRLNSAQLRAIERGGPPVEFKHFMNVFFEEYRRLKMANRGNTYVKIPDLERAVQNRFVESDFTTFDFRLFLKTLKGYSSKEGRILLSKPGSREPGGIWINSIYYYYVSIAGV